MTEKLRSVNMEVGSGEWFGRVYPAWAESEGMKKVRQRLEMEGRGSEFREVVEEWVGTQVFFFLAEFGAGKTLSVQPPYRANLYFDDGGVVVNSFNLPEYGNQKDSYTSFEGIAEPVRKGLELVYETLGRSKPGEGVARVSPTEFYVNYGSKYDVIELQLVEGFAEDGSRIIRGRYLVLDRPMNREERCFVNNWHAGVASSEGVVTMGGGEVSYSTQALVMNPQWFVYENVEGDATLGHVKKLNAAFYEKFGRELVGETDFSMYGAIKKRVDDNVVDLVEMLLDERGDEFVGRLSEMMFSSQREWAVRQNIDPDQHIWKIRTGQIPIGFEIGGFGEMVWDPVAKTWYESGSSEGTKHCLVHEEDYRGDACPKCKPRESEKNNRETLAA